MDKEKREKLVSKYAIPEEFTAPILNEQLRVKLSEKAVRRDSYRFETQNSISVALTALSSAITMINNVDENGLDQKDFVDKLTDACKIMADTQSQLNKARRAYIIPRFSKVMQETLKKSKPDKFLFGSVLTSKIKETKDADKLFEVSTSQSFKSQSTRGSGNFRRPQGNRPFPTRAGSIASR